VAAAGSSPTTASTSTSSSSPSVATSAACTVPIDWAAAGRDAETRPGVTQRWYADPDLTAVLLERLVSWCLAAPGELFFAHHAAQFRVDSTEAGDLLAHAVAAGPRTRLIRATGAGDFRRIAFDVHGRFTLTRRDSGTSWEADVDDLRRVVTDLAPHLEQGVIRRADVLSEDWAPCVNGRPRMPFGGETVSAGSPLLGLRHLLARRVTDAHGVQVLSDAHLAHAADLTAWDVRPLTPGRHLVRAAELAPWYATDQPGPDVVAHARADFGDLILSRQHLTTDGPSPLDARVPVP
jgi:hypothetical protein